MGLDLVPEGCPKPGHEAEWRRILEQSFAGEAPAEGEVERFQAISIPPHERAGAPRVGEDAAADAWIIEANKAARPDEIERVLEDYRGYHVLALARCDGVPPYSNGDLYDGVDETSFRGELLGQCGDALSPELIEQAWDHKFPEAAVDYGRALIAAADAAAGRDEAAAPPAARTGWLARLLGAGKEANHLPLAEQVDIVRAAGKWFLFWGEKGHAIRAWF